MHEWKITKKYIPPKYYIPIMWEERIHLIAQPLEKSRLGYKLKITLCQRPFDENDQSQWNVDKEEDPLCDQCNRRAFYIDYRNKIEVPIRWPETKTEQDMTIAGRPSVQNIEVFERDGAVTGKLHLPDKVNIMWVIDPDGKVPLEASGVGRKGFFYNGVAFPWSHDKRARGIIRDHGEMLAKSIKDHLKPKLKMDLLDPDTPPNTETPSEPTLEGDVQIRIPPTLSDVRERLALVLTALRNHAGHSFMDVAAICETTYGISRGWELGKPHPILPKNIFYLKLLQLYDHHPLLKETYRISKKELKRIKLETMAKRKGKGILVKNRNEPPRTVADILSTIDQQTQMLDIAGVNYRRLTVKVVEGDVLNTFEALHLDGQNKWLCFGNDGPFEVEAFDAFKRKEILPK